MNTIVLPSQLKRFIPFEDMPDTLVNELSHVFELDVYRPGECVFERGCPVDKARFLLSGQVVLSRSAHESSCLDGDAYENFMALDSSHTNHRYTALAEGECCFATVDRRYLELMTTWSEIARSQKIIPGQGDWLVQLLACKVFDRIPAGNIQELLRRFEERIVNMGDVVVEEGDVGEDFFVIKRGKALVTKRTHSEPLAALQDGDMFGEDALISALPRNATVTMSSYGELMVLPKADFIELLSQPALKYLDNEQLERLIRHSDTGVVLLDVRQPREVQFDPMLPARNIPLSELRQRLPGLSKDYSYVVMGEGRGEAAAYIMSEAGYRVKVLVKHVPAQVVRQPASITL